MIKVLFVSSSSICMELCNELPYYSPREYEVYLNGVLCKRARENVFSLFGLEPDSDYDVKVGGDELRVHTLGESACIKVTEMGAAGDGKREDTEAIQACIDLCPENGRVYFPAGDYLCAPLRLKSHITLELSRGARLMGVTEVGKYKVMPAMGFDKDGKERVITTWEGEAIPSRLSLLHGFDLENVKVIGEGEIDGNAQNSSWWTTECAQRSIGRPRLVFLNGCRNVVFHGITARNSPSWTLHPFYCDDVGFYDIDVFSPPKDAANTDGLDPEGCDTVKIIGCRFSTGDDCIAIKASKIDLAKKFQRAASRHTIRNCYMHHGHGAVVLGSEIGGGVRELSVSQCFFDNTDRGLRIKTRRGRGKLCVIDGLKFENIKMTGVGIPFVVNMYYNCDPDGRSEYVYSREKLPIDDRTPYIGKLEFKNVECRNTHAAAAYFDGLPEQPIKGIRLENVTVDYAEDARAMKPDCLDGSRKMCREGLYFDNVERVELVNVDIKGQDGESLILKHHKELFDYA